MLAVDAKKGEEKLFMQGTLGNLDIGWLNSRSALVDRNMEREMWQQAKKFLEDIKVEGHGGEEQKGREVQGKAD